VIFGRYVADLGGSCVTRGYAKPNPDLRYLGLEGGEPKRSISWRQRLLKGASVCSSNLSLNKFRICSTTALLYTPVAQIFYTTIHPSPGRKQERKGVGLEPKQFQNHARKLLGCANQRTVNANKKVQLLDMPRSINMIGEGFFNRHT